MYACTSNARRTYATLAALVATIGSGVFPRVVSAQRVAGSLDVALTVLPPVAPQSVTITRFGIDRDGLATIRADFPTSSRPSQLFVTRVSSSTDGFSVRLRPGVVRRPSDTNIGVRDVAYRIEIARTVEGDSPHEVRLRLECLVLAGT